MNEFTRRASMLVQKNFQEHADDGKEEIIYSEGESVFDDNHIDLSRISVKEKNEHLKELWRICILKSIGAS
jgi:hypothetical protein